MRFTIRQLEYFVATAEAGSIKLSSERINISQPAISSAISHLENELGVQLFVRHHARGLTLTPPGKRILREAKLLIRQASGLYALAGELTGEIRGPLSVGCLTTLAPMVLPELVHAFSKSHPDVSLSVVEGDPRRLVECLRAVEIDMAISYDLMIPDDIAYEPLVSLPPQVLLAGDHRFAGRKSLRLKDLAGEGMILLDLPYSRQYFLDLFETEGLEPNIHARSENQEVIRTMVANGFGFTIVNVRPRNLTARDGRELVSVPLKGRHKAMTIGMMSLRQDRKPRVVDAFEAHCRSMISSKGVPGMDMG